MLCAAEQIGTDAGARRWELPLPGKNELKILLSACLASTPEREKRKKLHKKNKISLETSPHLSQGGRETHLEQEVCGAKLLRLFDQRTPE